MPDQGVTRVLVVGGGTAGWMAATSLAQRLKAVNGQVTLVESKTIPVIGVGEATVPPLVGYLRSLGIAEERFVRETHATYKLGIKFINWHRGDDSFWHPFGTVGGSIDGVQLFHFWLKSLRAGFNEGSFQSYSLQALAGETGKAPRGISASTQMYERGQYAYHIDAVAMAAFLRKEGLARGVVHVEDDVTDVVVDARGHIESVATRDHGKLAADLYLDCSGFQGLLIEKAMGDGWVDWSDILLCDRALAAPLPHEPGANLAPYTRSTALSAGWSWQIPLSTRAGNGYVYCSRYLDDERAALEFAALLGVDPGRFEPRPLRMRVGRRETFWRGNCIAVGLSSGFVEPLESTGIFVIQRAIALLLAYFPDVGFEPSLARRFNARMTATYEEIRDFILLHYVLSQRDDTPFWRDYRAARLPDGLAQVLDDYQRTGVIEPVPNAVFPEPSWYAILAGQHCLPRTHHRSADLSNFDQVRHILSVIRRENDQIARGLAGHEALIASILRGEAAELDVGRLAAPMPGATSGI